MVRLDNPPPRTYTPQEGAGMEKSIAAGRGGTWRRLVKYRALYAMALPVLALFAVFELVPLLNNFLIGFVEYNLMGGVWKSPWVGLANFKAFFDDPFFIRLLRNTFLIGFYTLLVGFPAPILLALLFNEIRSLWFKKLAQTISYLPHFISTVVLVGFINSLFSSVGSVNLLLAKLGLPSVHFLGNPAWFRPLYIGSEVWAGIGWGTILYLAAIAGVNPELYEAAYMDGANRFRQALHVTLPCIAPTITILLILSVGNILKVGFQKVFLMQNDAILEVADVFKTYIYRRGIRGMEYGFAGAVGFFDSCVSLALIVIANFISRRVSESSLF